MFVCRWVSVLLLFPVSTVVAAESRPNVILIMSDDQGFGDIGYHGNKIIQTPHLDRLAEQSVRLTRFYVSPVCTPTRASLMTGRYNYRTRAIDTYIGRAMMDPAEVTVAEMLGAAGYRTGLFGKWHLGDSYPLRPQDQGFGSVLMHRGGGLGQPSDSPGNPGYTNAFLWRDGREFQSSGYCTDVFTDAAIEFIGREKSNPFFVYLAFNAPHDPLELPDADHALYRDRDLSPEAQRALGMTVPDKIDADKTARVYGMVTNLDRNLGRLFKSLDEQGLSQNTIVVFLTDNGPAYPRYNAGLRGQKASTYEGGIRAPCFIRWPARLKPADCESLAAHIDLTPTLLQMCGVKAPGDVRFDGVNLLPVIEKREAAPDRLLFFQWHRGDAPEPRRAFAVRSGDWKLVRNGPIQDFPPRSRNQNAKRPPEPPIELFDLVTDPSESHNLAASRPDVAAAMLAKYDAWFADVSATRGYDPPRIVVGTKHEPHTVLTWQDWRGPEAGWTATSVGFWELSASAAGNYRVVARFLKPEAKPSTEASVTVHWNDETFPARWSDDDQAYVAIVPDRVPGDIRLSAEKPAGGGKPADGARPLPDRAPRWVEVSRVE